MYSPTIHSTPSPRAHALSQELLALVRERRAQDPGLAVPETLIALELARTSLLGADGGAGVRQGMVAVALAAAALIAGLAVFLISA